MAAARMSAAVLEQGKADVERTSGSRRMSALGLGMTIVAIAATIFATPTREIGPDLNCSFSNDPHTLLWREAKRALEYREGWGHRAELGKGLSVAPSISVASRASPMRGSLQSLPPGSMRGCAGGGSRGSSAGGRSSGSSTSKMRRCTAPGCLWKRQSNSHKSLLVHWRSKHNDLGPYPLPACEEASEAEGGEQKVEAGIVAPAEMDDATMKMAAASILDTAQIGRAHV